MYYLNKGVQLCDTIILVPLNFCSFNVSCLFNGLVYYNQWDRLYWWQVVAVLIGITTLVFGVLLISVNQLQDDTLSSSSTATTTTEHHTSTSLLGKEQQQLSVLERWWSRILNHNRKSNQPNETTALLS